MSKFQKTEILKFAIKNSGSLFLVKTLGMALNYIVLILVLHLFGFEVNGELSNFIVQSKGLMILIVFGLDIVLVKSINETKNRKELIIQATQALLLNFLIFSIIFLVINFFYNLSYHYLFGGIILSIWRYVGHYYRGNNNMLIYGLFEFVVLQITVLIALLYHRLNDFTLIESILIVNGLTLLSTLLFFTFKYKNSFNKKLFNFSLINIILQYKKSFHFVLSGSIVVLSTSIIYLLIKANYSDETLGIYDTVLKFSQIVVLPLIATNGRVMALTSKFFNQRKLIELKEYIIKITKMLSITSTFCSLAVVVVYYVYSQYFNEQLKEYWLLLAFMILAQLVNSWAGPVGVVLQLTNNEKKFNIITFFSSLYLVFSTLIVSFFFEIEYIAVNYLIFMLLQNFYSLKAMKNNININYYNI